MPVVSPDKLIELQQKADDIRNICILAHVDHGKTSLTDALIATNGIISPKLAGKIRYLDSRPDEQRRGITMESSAISLYFAILRRPDPNADPVQKDYLINLIDSPGHIDFSSEVSTASRLCDGALVLVDAVEGVCSQTVSVLRQTWTEKLKPLLVINKMDRLIWELRLSPAEAYTHLVKLLEQVNAVIGTFFQGERMEEDLQWREKVSERVNAAAQRKANQLDGSEDHFPDDAANGVFEEKDDEDLYFAPEKNNVIFCSAMDGWAFTVKQFAALYEKKLGIKRAVLEKVLWGDYYLDPKTKRVLGHKHLKGRPLKPMFPQLVLENIWAVYNATTLGNNGKGDPAMVEKITNSLSLKLPSHVLRSKDPRNVMISVFSAWLPVSTAVLVSTIEYLPAPPDAQHSRMPHLLDASPGSSFIDPSINDSLINFQSSYESPVIAYVSKMVSVPESELPEKKRRGNTMMTGLEARDLARKKRAEIERVQAAATERNNQINILSEALDSADIDDTSATEAQSEDSERLIGFARIFSGTLSVGDTVYVLPPKFNPADSHAAPEPRQVTVTGLYLMMGRSLESLTTAPAGIVCGIGGLEGHVLKSATLSSKVEGAPNLAGTSMGSQPVVRVALEPVNPMDLDKMVHGLKLLEQSDPCARYEVLETGEHVILTAGELHLERCLKDLRERFARCEIQAGEPIVPFRETIVEASDMPPVKNKALPRGTVVTEIASDQLSIRIQVHPLPKVVTDVIEKHGDVIGRLQAKKKAEGEDAGRLADSVPLVESKQDTNSNELDRSINDLLQKLREAFAHVKGQEHISTDAIDRIVSFGPHRNGPNTLIDRTSTGVCPHLFSRHHGNETPSMTKDVADKIAYAFQLATAKGPICHEPMQGVAVFLDSIDLHHNAMTAGSQTPTDRPSSPTSDLPSSHDTSTLSSRLTSTLLKQIPTAIHTGFLSWSPRLMLAYYRCEIQSSTEVLGRTYTVLSRLHALIISEALNEGTPFYSIVALLPLATSFKMASELLKSTSGSAQTSATSDAGVQAQTQQIMQFHGFEILDEDPYWEPQTEEELEDYGVMGDRERWSKILLEGVRRRKGLVVKGEKVVKEGEKQKTLKR